MIIVDTALAKRFETRGPIRVGLVGAGYMARCIALQLVSAVKGLKLVAIANRTLPKATAAYLGAGVESVVRVSSAAALDRAIAEGRQAVTEDVAALYQSSEIEVIIEATGDVEYGTRACYEAIQHGKHVVMLGAEVDASVGPILKTYADRMGTVFTYTDGDEPGVGMNLFRFLDSMGYRPVLMGQLKGFLDRYRTPETQQEFARKHGQSPTVMACFADGSKLALEAAIMGNATGFVPQVRGMRGYPCAHVNDLLREFKPTDFNEGGLVEYALGAAPHTGAFVICHDDHPEKRRLMSYLKMGDGPLYLFYTPYHLPPWQVAHSVARAVLFNDPTITPRGAPVCDTVSLAKRDLKTGETLDGVGGFSCYGQVERYDVCREERFLPIAISLGCTLLRDVRKDETIRYSDVALPAGRLVDRLREEQATRFPIDNERCAPTKSAARSH